MRRDPLAGTLLLFLVALPALAGGRLSGPPVDAVQMDRNGKTYNMGTVYVSGHSDTTVLTDCGFQGLTFDGWSLDRAKYQAVWPEDLPLDSLPSAISSLSYDQVEVVDITGETVLIDRTAVPAWRLAEERARQLQGKVSVGRIRAKVISGGPGWQEKIPPDKSVVPGRLNKVRASRADQRVKLPVRKHPDAIEDAPEGTFQIVPVDVGVFHSPRKVLVSGPCRSGWCGGSMRRETDAERFQRSRLPSIADQHGNGGGGVQGWRRVGYRDFGYSGRTGYSGSLGLPEGYKPRVGQTRRYLP